MKKSTKVNVIYNLIYQLLTILLPLVTTPYISRVLGADSVGIYGYTLAISMYFILFGSLGISMYGQREIAKNQDNAKKYSVIFWELCIIRFITIFIAIIIYLALFCLNNQYSLYYIILILYILASAFDINWYFQGIEDFSKTVIRNIIVKSLGLVLTFVFVKTANDLWIYMLIFAATELLGNLSLWFYVPKYIEKPKRKELNLKKHFKLIMLLLVPQIATQIYTVLDKTMVGLITKDMSEVGFYEQSQKIARAALVIVNAMQTVMNSKVANAYIKKNNKELVKNLKINFDYVWFLGIPLTIGMAIVSSNLVPWYFGNGFDRVENILKFISPIIIIIGLNGVTGIVYLIQTERQNIYTRSVIFGALINVVANFILINLYGAVGAAIASVIAEIAIFIYHFKYIKNVYKIKDIFKQSSKCLFAGLVMALALLFFINRLTPSIIHTIFLVGIGFITYIGILFIVKYDYICNIINKRKKLR